MLTSRILLYTALVTTFLGLLLAGALYVRSATKAKADLAAARESNRVAQDALEQWQTAARRLQADLDAYRRVQHEAASQTRQLNRTFARHDLGRLLLSHPRMVEARVNRGTARVLELLECASRPSCAASATSTVADARSDPDTPDPLDRHRPRTLPRPPSVREPRQDDGGHSPLRPGSDAPAQEAAR